MTREPVLVRGVRNDGPFFVAPTEGELRRGELLVFCPACGGSGVCFWHPGFPDRDPEPGDRDGGWGCVECSTAGVVPVSV